MNKKKFILVMVVMVSLFLGGCQSMKRGFKGFTSNWGGGLNREIQVISQNGEVIYEDEGRFDIEVNDYRIKYINEDGEYIIVYLGNSTALIKEK